MEIKISIQSASSWESKLYGVIFVEKEEHIYPLWNLLVEQDSYWKDYKELIKVLPKKPFQDVRDLNSQCHYVGKTDIWNIPDLKAKAAALGIDFFIYQFYQEGW